jgi:hypothetical protein
VEIINGTIKNKHPMKKTVIILILFALLSSSCTKYHLLLSRVYFTDLQGKELDALYYGITEMQVCVETEKQRCRVKNCPDKKKHYYRKAKNVAGQSVDVHLQSFEDGRKFKGGVDTLLFEMQIDKNGNACRQFTLEYEPTEE